VQVMAKDVAVGFGGAGGYLEMNVYKPLIIFNITHSITIMTDGCVNFRKFLVEGTKPNLKKINEYVERSLMLVTALSPVIGYDKASNHRLRQSVEDRPLRHGQRPHAKGCGVDVRLCHGNRIRSRR
jgi:fumarate hydratase class II